ncbi:alpha-1,2-fucosyltransferase [Neomicrococcus lactis]|uniref:alpha-1,2-fucosyltransferase n=1 Tax=Neomicrococcus lactis TaxID=732241 RepID=UPI0023019A56|nr:alpha-1,2-fucosyltransferase [Neomicrococcus lactis]
MTKNSELNYIRKAIEFARRATPVILWTQDGLGAGNYLYLWLAAQKSLSSPEMSRVLYKENMAPWLDHFPRLRSLTIEKSQISLFQKRSIYWGQEFGVDFERAELHNFIRHFLLTSPKLAESLRRAEQNTPDDNLVINVRRGDYYSVDKFRAEYGFDVVGYVREALALLSGSYGSVSFVSDDLVWCTQYLEPIVPNDFEVIPHYRNNVFDDLAKLAVAPSLVLANSTFSYWGAYIRDVHQEKASFSPPIFANFHSRNHNNTHPWQIDPLWTSITEIPGGWQEKEVNN